METYIPSLTAIYEPELWIFAGVEGAGKTSMMGAWSRMAGKKMEAALTEEDISFLEKKAKQGTVIQMNYIGLETLEEHLTRIRNRVRKGGASADPEDVKKQFDRRWESLARVLPLCKEIYFYDNGKGFRRVGHYCNHAMEISRKSCRWFQEFLAEYFTYAGSGLTDDEKCKE